MSASTKTYLYLSAATYILLIATICSIHSISPTLALSSATTSASASARGQKKIIPRDHLLDTLTEDGLMILTKMGNHNNNDDREVSLFPFY